MLVRTKTQLHVQIDSYIYHFNLDLYLNRFIDTRHNMLSNLNHFIKGNVSLGFCFNIAEIIFRERKAYALPPSPTSPTSRQMLYTENGKSFFQDKR